MLTFRQATLHLDGKNHELKPGKINPFDTFYVDFQHEISGNQENHWSLFLHPKQDVKVSKITIEFQLPIDSFTAITTNGWQNEWPVRRNLFSDKYATAAGMWKGDASFAYLPSGAAIFHSWNHAVFHGNTQDLLIGSTNESTGFTVFTFDTRSGILTVHKDLNEGGLSLGHSFPLMNFCCLTGKPSGIMERYFNLREVPHPSVSKTWFWSTAGCTDLPQIQNGLEQAAPSGLPFSGILIDEGWATATGDWIAGQKIKIAEITALSQKNGLAPTLALSPFLAGVTSKTATQNPDWLVKDQRGQPLKITRKNGELTNILDTYHPGVRDFLSGFFHIAIEKWGIAGFYLSDLYVASAAAPREKTRGQAMYDAVAFLRQLTGNRLFIAGGIPFGIALGKVDVLAGPSTVDPGTVQSALATQYLRGTACAALGRNPALQKVKKESAANLQYTQSILNTLLHDIIVVQGEINNLSPEIRAELDESAMWQEAVITGSSWPESDLLRLTATLAGENRIIFSNFSAKKKTFWENKTSIELRPFETLTF